MSIITNQPSLNTSTMNTAEPDLHLDIQPEAIVGSASARKTRPSNDMMQPPTSRANAKKTVGGNKQVRTRYRACLLCSMVQSSEDWRAQGCPNCEDILGSIRSIDDVKQVSSLQFDGVIAMLRPGDSWVSRWQRTTSFLPGLYAARVTGRLPPYALEELERRGIPYVPRDNVAGD